MNIKDNFQKSSKFSIKRFVLYIVLIASSFTMVIPFYWSIITSLKFEQFVYTNPPQWFPSPATLQNFFNVFTKIHFGKFFLNSVFVTIVITLGHVFFDTLAAYAFSKLKFPGRDKIFFLLLFGLMVPFQVNLIPLYRIMGILGWNNSYLALIIPNLTSVFGIFMMRQFMLTIPDDLLDAGRIDGCGEFSLFWKIVAPLALPGIATLIILTFMGAWNDFLWPRIVINSETLFTLPVGLAQLQDKNTSNVALIMAGTVLSALPMIIVFLFMQRQFIEGMTAGAIKE